MSTAAPEKHIVETHGTWGRTIELKGRRFNSKVVPTLL